MFFTFQKRCSHKSAPSRLFDCCLLLLLFMWLLPVRLETSHCAMETVVRPCGQRELLEHFCGHISWEKTFLCVKCAKWTTVKLFHHWYYFPAGKKRNSAVGVEFTFLHLPHVMLHHIWDYNGRSCQVIKVCIKVCCSLNMLFTASRQPGSNGGNI